MKKLLLSRKQCKIETFLLQTTKMWPPFRMRCSDHSPVASSFKCDVWCSSWQNFNWHRISPCTCV